MLTHVECGLQVCRFGSKGMLYISEKDLWFSNDKKFDAAGVHGAIPP